jgi:hypothetical protein
MSHQNNPEAFPHLYLDQLERHAGTWAKRFAKAGIQRIVLCRYSSEYQRFMGGTVQVRFVVIFQVSGLESEDLAEPDGLNALQAATMLSKPQQNIASFLGRTGFMVLSADHFAMFTDMGPYPPTTTTN